MSAIGLFFNFNFILLLLLLLLIVYQKNVLSYGPTSHYPSLWNSSPKNDIKVISVPVVRGDIPPHIKPKFRQLPSFGVTPELLSDLPIGKFVYIKEFSEELSQIYSQYLK